MSSEPGLHALATVGKALNTQQRGLVSILQAKRSHRGL